MLKILREIFIYILLIALIVLVFGIIFYKYTHIQNLSERSAGGLFDGIIQGIEERIDWI